MSHRKWAIAPETGNRSSVAAGSSLQKQFSALGLLTAYSEKSQ
ncbi:MAG: hypothetical protein AAGA67_04930 [Cyanobacteria bacterium P01_F01_bin.153]